MKIAVAAYPIDQPEFFDAYAAKISAWVDLAAAEGAKLLVFPEYGSIELAAIANRGATLAGAAHGVSDFMDRAVALHQKLAREHRVYILMGSGPVWVDDHFVNRSYFVAPSGDVRLEDKRIMTRYEREQWHIKSGSPLQVFDTDLGRIGVLICYDAEFPLLGRALVEAGVELLLVPSCTDSLAGYTRVKVGAMARALEGQCVVAHSVTQGPAAWCPAVDDNVGAAAVYCPPDKGFPETGIIAQGSLDSPGWVYADVDLSLVDEVRKDGRVLNNAHWDEQFSPANLPQVVQLR